MIRLNFRNGAAILIVGPAILGTSRAWAQAPAARLAELTATAMSQ